MTPERRAVILLQNLVHYPRATARRMGRNYDLQTVAEVIREAERLALERAAKVAETHAVVAWLSSPPSVQIAEAIRALSQPETSATPSTDEEVRAWCERVYRETGVTPALRAAYEFYKANYRGETPAEKTEGT